MEPQDEPELPVAPIENRPLGVTLGAIALGVMGCAILLLAALMVLAFAAVRVSPPPNAPPFMAAMPLVLGGIFLIIAAACGAVAFYIFKRRTWARIGIAVIGVLQALMGFGGCAIYLVIGIVARSHGFPTPANGRPVDPHILQAIMLAASGFFLCVGLVGLWWAIYFNLRRVRDWFEHRDPGDLSAPRAASAEGSTIGILLNVYAVLLLFGAMSVIFAAALHMPLFFAGVILRGQAAVIFDLTLAVACAGVGVSLLRRDKIGWYGAFVLQAHTLIAWTGMLLPHARQQMLAYQLEIHNSFGAGTAAPPPSTLLNGPLMICCAVFGTLMVIAVVWLLVRARRLFFPVAES